LGFCSKETFFATVLRARNMEIPLMFPHNSGPLQWAHNCTPKVLRCHPARVRLGHPARAGLFYRLGTKKNKIISCSLFFAQPPSPEWGFIFDIKEEIDKEKLRRFDQHTKQTRGDGVLVIHIIFF